MRFHSQSARSTQRIGTTLGCNGQREESNAYSGSLDLLARDAALDSRRRFVSRGNDRNGDLFLSQNSSAESGDLMYTLSQIADRPYQEIKGRVVVLVNREKGADVFMVDGVVPDRPIFYLKTLSGESIPFDGGTEVYGCTFDSFAEANEFLFEER